MASSLRASNLEPRLDPALDWPHRHRLSLDSRSGLRHLSTLSMRIPPRFLGDVARRQKEEEREKIISIKSPVETITKLRTGIPVCVLRHVPRSRAAATGPRVRAQAPSSAQGPPLRHLRPGVLPGGGRALRPRARRHGVRMRGREAAVSQVRHELGPWTVHMNLSVVFASSPGSWWWPRAATFGA